MDSITLIFTHERDTKNTRRFQEQVEDGNAPLIGTLYITKHVQTADTLVVTVEAQETKTAPRKRTTVK